MLPATKPLVPHTGSVGPPAFPSTYSWRVYVTEAAGAPSKGAYRVTVRVSWEANVRRGLRNFVEAQTLIYSPKGCVDPATHPFSAPCQPYYYGNGSAGGGTLQTTGTVSGVAFDSIGFGLLGQTSDAQVEQVTHISSSVNLPSAASVIEGSESGSPATSAVSAADDDPSSATGTYERQTAGPQAPSTVTVQGEGNQITVSIGGSSAGTSASTTQASAANSCNLQTDNRPCGFGSGTAAGPVTESLVLSGGTGTANLVSVGTSASPVTTYVRRFVPAGGEPGLIRETVTWNLPQISMGGLPSGLASTPSGWQGYWVRLTGFNASTAVEAGLGTIAPTASITGGQISYWNGRGYSTLPVSTAGGDVAISPVDFSAGTGDGNTVRVEVSGTVSFKDSGVTQQIQSGSTRLRAQGTIGSPLIVNLEYRVSRNDVQIADLALQFTAGGARASVVYQPAPTT
jgi:hypothetical protein